MGTTTTVATRFWLGMALPTFGLAVFTVLLALIGGKGKEFAPILLLLMALVTLPLTMLANGWTLFVGWRRGRLVAGAFVLPAIVAVIMALFLQGPHYDRGLPAAILAPCLTLLETASKHPVVAFTAWVLSIAALMLLARRTHRTRSR
ncbi:MAG: hypothetical protein AB7I59_23295 [Geminicoccaceae bacterium]|uniref:hypothetical protein n=1 Tax=Reyranella sp. TaxID=1929291 RepID=UPI003D13CA8D